MEAPSQGQDLLLLCLWPPTCLLTCQYGTDARGQKSPPSIMSVLLAPTPVGKVTTLLHVSSAQTLQKGSLERTAKPQAHGSTPAALAGQTARTLRLHLLERGSCTAENGPMRPKRGMQAARRVV